eukprot:comp22380_c0_seq1/m.54253 comp22380_c0_seq1/g.54253  ORF comp22380_c0_seq1/g.54253 comp22380_c0_seq1/m.54253 type:complete len:801 (-) comp22380_c0_seq1:361-2763(-)
MKPMSSSNIAQNIAPRKKAANKFVSAESEEKQIKALDEWDSVYQPSASGATSVATRGIYAAKMPASQAEAMVAGPGGYGRMPPQLQNAPDLFAQVADDAGVKAGTAEITVASLLSLIDSAVRAPVEDAPVVVSTRYLCDVKKSHVAVNASIEIAVHGTKPVAIPLCTDSLALVSSAVKFAPLSSSSASASSSSKKDGDDKSDQGENPGASGYITLKERAYVLFAKRPGLFSVTLSLLCPFFSARRIQLPTPRATINHLEFRVPDKIVQVKVEPVLDTNTVANAPSGTTAVACSFPPTTRLSIQWFDDFDVDADADAPVVPVVSVVNSEHGSLFSIGEGVVQGTTKILYTVISGSRSFFEVAVNDPDVSIISVTGTAIKRWECTPGSAGSSQATIGRTIKIWLEFAAEENFDITIRSEKTMGSTSGDVKLPGFTCLECPRDIGYISVCARTSVEVDALEVVGLTPIDVSELPVSLKMVSAHPLLLAYKFLMPGYSLTVTVKRHNDVDVLIAAVDKAHFLALLTPEGRAVYRLLFRIRNTQKQFMRLMLPEGAQIWSTSVNGVSTKPARDTEGNATLIPLKKSSGSSQIPFLTEVVYVQERPPMGAVGNLEIVFPEIDMPIDMLLATVALPDDYRYAEFSGDLKEVTNFSVVNDLNTDSVCADEDLSGGHGSHNVRNAWGAPNAAPIAQCNAMPPPQQMRQQQVQSQSLVSTTGGGARALFDSGAGMLPVTLDIRATGTEFRFEQRLVVSTSRTLKVAYKITKGRRSKRSLDDTKKMLLWVSMGVLAIAVLGSRFKNALWLL